jgi:hypothetical protein
VYKVKCCDAAKCGKIITEMLLLKQELWSKIVSASATTFGAPIDSRAHLCMNCMEAALARPLTFDDLREGPGRGELIAGARLYANSSIATRRAHGLPCASNAIGVSPDANVNALTREMVERSYHGYQKYRVTTERADLTEEQWLQHAKEEALDLAVYLQAMLANRRKGRQT